MTHAHERPDALTPLRRPVAAAYADKAQGGLHLSGLHIHRRALSGEVPPGWGCARPLTMAVAGI